MAEVSTAAENPRVGDASLATKHPIMVDTTTNVSKEMTKGVKLDRDEYREKNVTLSSGIVDSVAQSREVSKDGKNLQQSSEVSKDGKNLQQSSEVRHRDVVVSKTDALVEKGDHYRSYPKRNRERFHGRDYHDNDETRERNGNRYRGGSRYPEQHYHGDRHGDRYRKDYYKERHQAGFSATGPMHRVQRSKVKGRDKDDRSKPKTLDSVSSLQEKLPLTDKETDLREDGGDKVTDRAPYVNDEVRTQRKGRSNGFRTDYYRKPKQFDHSRQFDRKPQGARSPRQPRRGGYADSTPHIMQRQSTHDDTAGSVPREEPISKNKEPVSKNKEPISKNKEPISKSKEPISKSKEPVSKNEELISKSKEPVSKNEEPVSKSKEPVSKNEELISKNAVLEVKDPKQSTETLKTTSHPDSSQKPMKSDKKDSTKSKFDSYNYTKQKSGSDKQTQNYSDKKPRNRTRGRKAVPTIQSDQLAQELTAGTYECMVCCDRVRGRDQVWSCESCFHVFHLRCIKKWASAPRLNLFDDEGTPDGWQCPSCRNTSTIVPTVYRCFCGRVINPRQRNRDLTVPHTCGELCLRKLAVGPDSSCRHKCRLPCHPGPCPPCPVMVTRTCPCGRQPHKVRCSRPGDLPSCGAVCGRSLTCGRHVCEDTCHSGSCRRCEEVLNQQCYCRRVTREGCCGEEDSVSFSCGQVCNRELNCGNHLCELSCHDGPCPSCPLLPSAVISCPCGATPLSDLLSDENKRISCLDPVPTCERVCGKTLVCSTSDDPHLCPSLCHLGECPPCDKTSTIHCLCGWSTTSVSCVEVVGGMGAEFRCGRVCNKKKSCGRHRCNTRCCVDIDHQCELLCGKKLRCGQHYCQENCHRGHCQQCWEYSYDELTCHCGAEIVYPPIPCGTRPPACSRPCARIHPCGHPVNHDCHGDEVCPPCTFLMEKLCVGEHEVRRNIPCHINEVSCGSVCSKPLSCGMHKCQRGCHRGNCLETSSGQCQQPCTNKRKMCNHACKEACHVGRLCPDTPCQTSVEVKCECGRRREKVLCLASESGAMHQTFQMFSKDLGSTGEPINISSITSTSRAKHRQLDCDEICKQMKRNKELALALDIENPILDPLEAGVSGESIQYPTFLLEEARSDLEFVSSVEEPLRALVESALKGSSNVTHKHSFRPMKSNQRKIIHELSVYYGCETTSYDAEPVRNVTVYATKSRAKLPSLSLSKLIERERYKPPPAPVHVMAVSGREDSESSKKLEGLSGEGQQSRSAPVPDYFADDLQL